MNPRPAGSQMFSGTRSPTSPGGVRTTPYEAYANSQPANRVNQQEFWKSEMAKDYAPVNLMRSALGQAPVDTPYLRQALLQRRRQQQGPQFGGMNTAIQNYGRQPTGIGGGLAPGAGGWTNPGFAGAGPFNGAFRPQPTGTPGVYTQPYSPYGPNGTNPGQGPFSPPGGWGAPSIQPVAPQPLGPPSSAPNPYYMPPQSTVLR